MEHFLTHFIITVPAFLLALVLHEVAHGYVAYLLGDDTAKLSGRLSLNPLAHLDPVGTLMFVLSTIAGRGIGWAKPVPVNPLRLRHPRRDDLLVSLAGVGANALQALVWAGLARIVLPYAEGASFAAAFVIFAVYAVEINLVLMVFNLIPIPPLDGSHVLLDLLNLRDPVFQIRVFQVGPMVLLLLVFLAPQALSVLFGHTVDPLLRLLLPPELSY